MRRWLRTFLALVLVVQAGACLLTGAWGAPDNTAHRVTTRSAPVWSIGVPDRGTATVKDNAVFISAPSYVLVVMGFSAPAEEDLKQLAQGVQKASERAASGGKCTKDWTQLDIGGTGGLYRLCQDELDGHTYSRVEVVLRKGSLAFACRFYTLPDMEEALVERIVPIQLASIQNPAASLSAIPSMPVTRGTSLPSAQSLGYSACSSCGGSGRCWPCGGSGRSGSYACSMCGGSGRCYYCGGSGSQ